MPALRPGPLGRGFLRGRAAIAILAACAARPSAAAEETDLTGAEVDALLASLVDRADLPARAEALANLLDAQEGAREALAERLFRPRPLPPSLLARLTDDYMRAAPATLEGSPVAARTPLAPLLHALVVSPHDVYRDSWAVVFETVALLAALDAIDTTEATLDAIRLVSAHEGAFARPAAIVVRGKGERAIPALILSRRVRDQSVRDLASQQLARLGKDRAPLMAQVHDEQLLAEILAAIGEVRDPDGVHVMLSFINADRPLVRKAARAALLRYERNALWAVRGAYEDSIGERPGAGWDWRETTERLFSAMDAARMAPLDALLARGLTDAAAGRYREMIETYGAILAREPEYPRGAEMVPGLLAHGEKLLQAGEVIEARRVLRMAGYLAPPGRQADRIRAHLAYLEGLRRRDLGFPDPEPFREAATLDDAYAKLVEARGDIDGAAEAGGPVRETAAVERSGAARERVPRIAAAAGIAVAAIAALLLLVSYRRVPGRLLPWPREPGVGGADAASDPPALASDRRPPTADPPASGEAPPDPYLRVEQALEVILKQSDVSDK